MDIAADHGTAPAGFALRARGLRVDSPKGPPIIDAVSFDLAKGEILGIVGESGSGKTTCAMATLGMSHPGARLIAGTMSVNERNVDLLDAKAVGALRGRSISYVPQSPGTALNPAMRVEAALKEMARRSSAGRAVDGSASDRAIRAALEKVDLPVTPAFLRRFPHQLSGGQQQRVCIAMALLSGAEVVILDEPTTGLDVITQQSVIAELKRLRRDIGLSMLYISHDLAVVSQLADRIAVMYCGAIVELDRAERLLRSPSHPYTRGLLASTLDFRRPAVVTPMPGAQVRPSSGYTGCAFAPRCPRVQDDCRTTFPELRSLSEDGEALARCHHPVEGAFDARPSFTGATRTDTAVEPVLAVEGLTIEYKLRGQVLASVNDVSFKIEPGQCLALLGESGSGKSTIARTVAGLKEPTTGSIRLNGADLAPLAAGRTIEQRRRLQMVFQNSSAALNPREDVRTAIERGRALRRPGQDGHADSVEELLGLVRLPASMQHRFPRELSGGERQRVCIARALAASPDVLVCDEVTSALAVSVQASVLKLMKDVQRDLGLALLFITHDMGVVSYLADAVVVLDRGRVCESGATAQVLNAPRSGYAQRLMAAVPSLGAATDGRHVATPRHEREGT